MKIIETECLILKKKEINESDLLVTFFSKELGKISGVAFGIRNSKKRNPITLNPLNIVQLSIQKRNEYYTITESEIIKNFKNITKDIEKLEISLYILDSINKIYDVTYKDEDFFYKLIEILDFINSIEKMEKEYKFFIILTFLRRLMLEQGIYEMEEIKKVLGIERYVKYREIISFSKNGEILKKYNKILKKIITIFEKYINQNLQVELEIKKFLVEDW